MSSPLMVSLLAAAWLSSAAARSGPGSLCDDGKVSLHRDLPLDVGWTCPHAAWARDKQDGPSSTDTVYDPQPSSEICMDRPISYKHSIPHSGPHRPIRAESGQYLYCPPQRWINNLHQGAVVLLYHPCSPLSERTRLSALAHTCLSDYVMTSHWELCRDQPLALVSWGRTLELTSVATSAVCDWLAETAAAGPPRNHGHAPPPPAPTRKYNLLLQRSGGRGHGHAPLEKDLPDTIRRCCEKILFPHLDGGGQRMRRSVEVREIHNLTISSASINQFPELLHREAHNTDLLQEAHNTALHQEAHNTNLHQEAHNNSLHQEAHNTNLHQEAQNTSLHQQTHNTDLHQEANTDLHQEANNTDLHQQTHNTDPREAPPSPDSNIPNQGSASSSGPHTSVDPHTADLSVSGYDPEPQRSSSNPKSPPPAPPHPGWDEHSHPSEELRNGGSTQRPLSPPTAHSVNTQPDAAGAEASETDGRRGEDVAQRNFTTETEPAGDKRTNHHVSHGHNVTPYATQKKTGGHAEEKRKNISLLDVTEREAVKKRTHTDAHGSAHGDVHGNARARSRTQKSSSTSPPPPRSPPPKSSSRPPEGASMSSHTPRTDEAVWAAAALGFLLVLLALSVLHTRLYRHWRTTPSLYWRDPRLDYDSVADVIRRRLRVTNGRRGRRSSRSRRQECVLLPTSSSSDDSQ